MPARLTGMPSSDGFWAGIDVRVSPGGVRGSRRVDSPVPGPTKDLNHFAFRA
jgi:hypothetical protein